MATAIFDLSANLLVGYFVYGIPWNDLSIFFSYLYYLIQIVMLLQITFACIALKIRFLLLNENLRWVEWTSVEILINYLNIFRELLLQDSVKNVLDENSKEKMLLNILKLHDKLTDGIDLLNEVFGLQVHMKFFKNTAQNNIGPIWTLLINCSWFFSRKFLLPEIVYSWMCLQHTAWLNTLSILSSWKYFSWLQPYYMHSKVFWFWSHSSIVEYCAVQRWNSCKTGSARKWCLRTCKGRRRPKGHSLLALLQHRI